MDKGEGITDKGEGLRDKVELDGKRGIGDKAA